MAMVQRGLEQSATKRTKRLDHSTLAADEDR
jgi:hypothetical protein